VDLYVAEEGKLFERIASVCLFIFVLVAVVVLQEITIDQGHIHHVVVEDVVHQIIVAEVEVVVNK
jgi:hypothetical protein